MGLFKKKNKDAAAGAASVADAAPAPGADADAAPAPIADVASAADGELIAVITAAIAAFEAEQFRQTLYIRKLDRTAGMRPVWGVTGTQEAIDVRRI